MVPIAILKRLARLLYLNTGPIHCQQTKYRHYGGTLPQQFGLYSRTSLAANLVVATQTKRTCLSRISPLHFTDQTTPALSVSRLHTTLMTSSSSRLESVANIGMRKACAGYEADYYRNE